MSEYDDKLTKDKYGAVNPDKTPVEICYICGQPFETSKMRKFRGHYYCKPNECFRDIKGILARERGKGRR